MTAGSDFFIFSSDFIYRERIAQASPRERWGPRRKQSVAVDVDIPNLRDIEKPSPVWVTVKKTLKEDPHSCRKKTIMLAKKIHIIIIIIDRSGSMQSIAGDETGGFTQFLHAQQVDGNDAGVTFVQFDSQDPQG